MPDRFGNPNDIKRLKVPRNGNGASISGLAVGYVEIKGQLYRITVTGTNNPKDDRHVGWINVSHRKNQGGGNFGSGGQRRGEL